MSKKVLVLSVLLLSGAFTPVSASAAAVNNGDLLSISSAGSYFALDFNGDGNITNEEKTSILPGPDGGIVIGAIQLASGSHSGPPDGSEGAHIDAPWLFFSNTGMHSTTAAVTGDTTSGLNLSGWTVTWNNNITLLGTNAWQPLNCSALGCTGYTFTNGIAWFRWDGVYGDTYTLDYTATESSLFGLETPGYYLHLEGTVQPVPIPTAFWLFGSGLIGYMGLAWRKRRTV